jgi:hypothetical protein
VKVELRVDGGDWQACSLATVLGPNAWAPWHAQWQATPGRHTLRFGPGVETARRAKRPPPLIPMEHEATTG